jgi:hypothetical protein
VLMGGKYVKSVTYDNSSWVRRGKVHEGNVQWYRNWSVYICVIWHEYVCVSE